MSAIKFNDRISVVLHGDLSKYPSKTKAKDRISLDVIYGTSEASISEGSTVTINRKVTIKILRNGERLSVQVLHNNEEVQTWNIALGDPESSLEAFM